MEVITELMRRHVQKLASSGKRLDGRAPDQVRPLTIQKGFVNTAEGSARVSLGNTDVLVGVKVELGEPFADRPLDGVLTTNAELVPMASPSFEAGPPGPEAVELARVVDRGIRETGTIDLKKLVLEPGKQVWVVFIDIHVLDYDGNLFDAASYGALAALTSARVPADKIGKEPYPLPLEHYPVSVTVAKVGGTLLVDPALDEEQIADARLTLATDENGNVRAAQKGLSGSFTVDEVKRVSELSRTLGKGIRAQLLA